MSKFFEKNYRKGILVVLVTIFSVSAALQSGAQSNAPLQRISNVQWECSPTPPDSLGPFYKPGAPQRRQVGTGYYLIGTVISAATCEPIPHARIELWMAGPDGNYSDKYRATIKTGPSAAYQFKSHITSGYSGRPPHIHMRISAKGFKTLVTQHYPDEGQPEDVFDLVLVPDK